MFKLPITTINIMKLISMADFVLNIHNKVEDLLKHNLTLTPKAIKQIGT